MRIIWSLIFVSGWRSVTEPVENRFYPVCKKKSFYHGILYLLQAVIYSLVGVSTFYISVINALVSRLHTSVPGQAWLGLVTLTFDLSLPTRKAWRVLINFSPRAEQKAESFWLTYQLEESSRLKDFSLTNYLERIPTSCCFERISSIKPLFIAWSRPL